ncbi:MAG: DUF3299 domain-containing protein [bacterium]
MITPRFLYAKALLVALLVNVAALADEPREITWEDLVPAEAEFDDAFTKLDDDQLYELSLVMQTRDQIATGEEVSDEIMAQHRKYEKNLKEQGVDIDGLIAIRDKVIEEREAKTFLANQELDGKPVRIPGYLLPLEFDGDKVSEFLLVPYVGACIHTPPPPPNQIVHVKTEEAYTTEGGLYTPVWVNGLMTTEQYQSNLSFVDGASNVPSAYSLEADTVEPYEE